MANDAKVEQSGGGRRELTPASRGLVWAAIRRGMAADDREPRQVIRERYADDEQAYLVDMARYLGIGIEFTTA